MAGLKATTSGVDASEADLSNDPVNVARSAAKLLGCVVAVTGAVDVISDGERTVTIHNGHKMLARVTGTGCMTTALVGAFAGATTDYLKAAAAGCGSYGHCR